VANIILIDILTNASCCLFDKTDSEQTQPTLDDQMHCVVFVIDANIDAVTSTTNLMKYLKRTANKKGVLYIK